MDSRTHVADVALIEPQNPHPDRPYAFRVMVDGYGYSGRLDSILEQYIFAGTYLDNAAAPLVAKSVAFKSAEYMASNQVVNPHSRSFWSEKTLGMINETRNRVLDMLGAPEGEFDMVFTANATAALKLIGECIAPYKFIYHTDSHTSVVGLRALSNTYRTSIDIGCEYSLDESSVVCWPLQSNFDGTRYPLEWVSHVRSNSAISILDLSSYCSTSMPTQLKEWPDMAVLSFYKIFGLPDLGGLIIRKSERTRTFFESRLYAGGGTVSSLAPNISYMVRSEDLCTGLEDGTLPFHSIAMLSCAMTEFQSLYGSFTAISAHTMALRNYCHHKLQETGLCTILSPASGAGPIVTFNLKSAGYFEFSNVCNKLDIHVRTGTLCNVGAFTLKSQISDEELVHNHRVLGKTCSDEQEFLNGKETGVIRVSLAPYNSKRDVDRLVDCITTYFGDPKATNTLAVDPSPAVAAKIKELIVYPIKSCAGLKLEQSAVFARGLEWDREYCLVNPETKNIYSLKSNLCMAKIHACPSKDALEVRYLNTSIIVPCDPAQWPRVEENEVSVCGPRLSDLHLNLDPKIVKFFSAILQKPCTIAKLVDQDSRHSRNASSSADVPLSLSNSSPILLISTESSKSLDDADHHVFRANVVVESSEPWDEDTWKQVLINNGAYDILGPCRRCNMVCVTREGESDPGPYLSLTQKRRFGGKLWFGQHMQTHGLDENTSFQLKVGDRIKCLSRKPAEY